MAWWVPMAVGAGMGVLQNQREQREAGPRKDLYAEMARTSPWTGIAPPQGGEVAQPMAPYEAALGGAVSGFGFGESAGLTDAGSMLRGGSAAPSQVAPPPAYVPQPTAAGPYSGPADAPVRPAQPSWYDLQGFNSPYSSLR